jgi:hypothetical protein
MFAIHVPFTANIPTPNQPLTKKDNPDGIQFKTVPVIFYSATRNDTTGTFYLKMLNTTAKKETVKINLDGIGSVSPEATFVVIKGNKPDDTNTITAPENVVPVTSKIKGIGDASFIKRNRVATANILANEHHATSISLSSELEKLHELKQRGVLTENEYASLKYKRFIREVIF